MPQSSYRLPGLMIQWLSSDKGYAIIIKENYSLSCSVRLCKKITVIPIKDTKKECMAILTQQMAILANDETSMRNPDSSPGIYFTTDKVVQCRLVVDNSREKEEQKK